MKKIAQALAVLLALSACATSGPATNYRPYLAKKKIHEISPSFIPHCRGYGCRFIDSASLPEKEWKKIGKLFRGKKTPEAERAAIAKAIGLLEQKIGKQTGTDKDTAGTYVELGNFQHDCVDESVNTTVYLALLTQKKFLKFHDVSAIMARVPVVGGGLGPHQTAVIVEKKTATRFAVDSWFHDNGHAPEIVLLDQWVYGWRPSIAAK